jgi:hypothetical protein
MLLQNRYLAAENRILASANADSVFLHQAHVTQLRPAQWTNFLLRIDVSDYLPSRPTEYVARTVAVADRWSKR